MRFDVLAASLGLSEIVPNTDPKILLSFTETGHGTSIIVDGALYAGAKNFHRVEPDRRVRGDLLEIKDDISTKSWAALLRGYHFSRNDVFRLSLLRMATNCVSDVRKRYADLSDEARLIADRSVRQHTKAAPSDRLYLEWDDLVSVIGTPDDNLAMTEITAGGQRLPVKVVAGMENFATRRLFLVDDEIMDLWADL